MKLRLHREKPEVRRSYGSDENSAIAVDEPTPKKTRRKRYPDNGEWLRKPKHLKTKVEVNGPKESMVIRPQAGKQEMFLNCPADVAIYGGAAGGGKSWALAYDPGINAMRFPGFTGAVFRRTTPMLTNPGGFLSETENLYPQMGAVLNRSLLEWRWPNGSVIKLSQLQYQDTVNDWQSAQLGEIVFDELTQFEKRQFFYMLSRLRSKCGIKPYVRAGCNPDPLSWVKSFIAWWLTPEGYADESKAGVIRWFAVEAGEEVWADTREALVEQGYPNPMSCAFVPAKLDDNQVLMKADPTYKSKLDALNVYDRALLRDGCWNVSKASGMLYEIGKVQFVDAAPADVEGRTRYWDRAATEKSDVASDPDWTAGVKMSTKDGLIYIEDVCRFRGRPDRVKERIKMVAEVDGFACEVGLEQDPGSAGVSEIDSLVKSLAGKVVYTDRVTDAKFIRAKPLASQMNVGNVCIVRGPWNSVYLQELDLFVDEKQVGTSDGYHDDQVDASSGAYKRLTTLSAPRIR